MTTYTRLGVRQTPSPRNRLRSLDACSTYYATTPSTLPPNLGLRRSRVGPSGLPVWPFGVPSLNEPDLNQRNLNKPYLKPKRTEPKPIKPKLAQPKLTQPEFT